MNLEVLKKRIADLTEAIERSAANHNAMCGRLAEAKTFLEEMEKVVQNEASKVIEVTEKLEG